MSSSIKARISKKHVLYNTQNKLLLNVITLGNKLFNKV